MHVEPTASHADFQLVGSPSPDRGIFAFVFLVEDYRFGRDERQTIARLALRGAKSDKGGQRRAWHILGDPPAAVRPGVRVELERDRSGRLQLARVIG